MMRDSRNFRSRIHALIACAALALLAPATAQTPAPEPGLPMWVVRDADSTIYITGTVHILRDDDQWRSPKLDAALESAGELRLEVAEIADADAALQAVIGLLPEYGAYSGEPVTSLLTAEERTRLSELLVEASIPSTATSLIDTHQPWFAIYLLGRDDITGGVHKLVNGVDRVLGRWAIAHGVPVKGMEPIEAQIALSAGLSFEDQFASLRYKLHPSPVQQLVSRRLIDTAFGSWLRGETALTEALVGFMYVASGPNGEGTDALLKNRNEAWAAEIEEMLKGSGTTFIAVGAAHLVGKDSLQQRLKLRGIDSERY